MSNTPEGRAPQDPKDAENKELEEMAGEVEKLSGDGSAEAGEEFRKIDIYLDDKIELNTTDTPLGVMRREIKGKVVGFFTTFPDKENGLLKPSYFMKLKPLDGSRVENIFLGNIVAGWWTFKKLIL